MSKHPFITLNTTVPEQWIDYNGHMNTRHYADLIYDAHLAFTDTLQLAKEYTDRTQSSKATVETHTLIERELRLNDSIEVHSWVVGFDNKRLHTFHEIYCTNGDYRAAAGEFMDVHFNLETRRSTDFPKGAALHLQSIVNQCSHLPRPSGYSGRIALPEK